MLFVLFLLLFWYQFAMINSQKPTFFPFCISRNFCKLACNCTAARYCSSLEMSDDLRQNITYYMNHIRDMQTKGRTKASSLSMLQYDHQLEEISSCWALKCENEFSECYYTPRFSETSQNVGIANRKEPSLNLWHEIISSWLGEMKYLTIESLHSLPPGEDGLKIHNVAQLLSERIFYVGCSWSMSPKFVLLVCTFGPRGPLPGQPILRTGIPCSACPFGEVPSSTVIMPTPPSAFKPKARRKVSRAKRTRPLGNLKHPWSGIYIMLVVSLIAVTVISVVGFACYCIIFY
ncbi:venom allergen 5-like isoform X2 [Coccinella septempunctata]|uniref:venom allergen 5-like isoform X2 n=1 Tax=Coccinella septempunctata TaxID=41139 RepID=UPI001D08F0C0|nr:venom allergen 5-like isoform X2 [Coccinella septempunctata]